MDLRNRIGLYGSYFFGMAAIGFTLPYLPLFLGEKGLSDRAIGIVSTLAALSGLAQFPVGLWSDRVGRKPFLVAALAVTAVATLLIRNAEGVAWLGFLVILFAENGIGRAVVESLSGAEAAALAPKGGVGAALGALRFWKPIGIVLVALLGSWMSEEYGVDSILVPLAVAQGLAVAFALLIHESKGQGEAKPDAREADARVPAGGWVPKDPALWAFVAAMVLYHAANAPGGVYLGLFLKRDLHAPERMLAYAFAVSMVAWMLVVWPAGRLADRLGRKPLLIAGWTIMAVRLGLVAMINSPWLAVANQALDGLGNGLFAVLAAAWVTDRLADPRRAGEAQVIVGSCLVLGSAIGPAAAGFLVDPLGYRGLFAVLAGVGLLATAIVVFLVPETLRNHDEVDDDGTVEPMGTTSDLSTVP
ncbi:Multidrug resistance protein MdtL [Aquisphaera giovannonii]|uniref:Multidrug resistance protein MdtL n=1 Tax=Aquisphaera giovannonii TaxID=406548 RepID=A0A5B9VXE3_9BACT|nr:MFS transporter [Aquisphaera giovannonii]QEH32370.1 Multidrug resistance protein MdtL [Aquisphaera giovannonii]